MFFCTSSSYGWWLYKDSKAFAACEIPQSDGRDNMYDASMAIAIDGCTLVILDCDSNTPVDKEQGMPEDTTNVKRLKEDGGIM